MAKRKPTNFDTFFVILRIIVMALNIIGLHYIYWTIRETNDD